MRRWRPTVIQRGESYHEVYDGFRWELPERFNIGVAACDRHADGGGRRAQAWPGRSALLSVRVWHYQAPREIVFVPELPLTATGKIMRRELRALLGG